MTQFEKKYFSIERLHIESRLDYLNCMYSQTHDDSYSALADVYSTKLTFLKQIMADLHIDFDKKVKV